MFSRSILRGPAVLGLLLAVSACDSNEPDPNAGEPELITRIRVTMTNAADAQDVQTVTALDADGSGDGFEITGALALRRGATYTGAITLDDTVNNVDITDEIGDEAEAHLFRYTVTPTSAATVTLTDRESEYGANTGADLPVGLRFQVVVGAAAPASGQLNATLFHFEEGVVKSSGTATSDERDVDIDFPVTFAEAR